MKQVIYKNCIFVLSGFFAMSANIKAMDGQEPIERLKETWEVVSTYLENLERVDVLDEDRGSVNSLLSSVASTAMSESAIPLQEMRFDIMSQAFSDIARENNIIYPFEDRVPRSFSDRNIERTLERKRIFLYSSAANIREWQIAEKILKIIDEKIDNSPSVGSVIDYLRSFRKATSTKYKLALLQRRKFLTDALKIAADLDTLKILYNTDRSHFENGEATMSLCENLYKAKDSIANSLSENIIICEDFVNNIKNMEVSLTRLRMGSESISELLERERFLEDLQRAFESPEEDTSSCFNPEDRAVFLSVIRERLDFYKNERATLEAHVAATARAEAKIAEETAARIASDRAVMDLQRVAAVTTQLEEALQRAEVKSIEAERLSFEAKLAAGRIRADAEAAASATASVAAEKASRIAAEALANAIKVRNEADADAAGIRAQTQTALVKAREAERLSLVAAEKASLAEKAERSDEAISAAVKARYNEAFVIEEGYKTIDTGLASIVGGVAASLAGIAGAPVIVPATIAAGSLAAAATVVHRVFF